MKFDIFAIDKNSFRKFRISHQNDFNSDSKNIYERCKVQLTIIFEICNLVKIVNEN